ncbi:11529_t:CDS:2 [Diversispora eburnea]|uniref:11529_t:CDS:1 n=1 Tax=Diversispora eburnea TaxID=1213867 RepID=A0A9N9AT33_9GLOM|nr:11529_t:CDS:2 [Diversispora eburnea]
MESYDNLIKYNDDDSSVSVPFGRAAEWYISKHPLLKNIRLKARSRLRTPQLLKEGIISIKRVEGAVDFVEWTTSSGNVKSTNRIDDIIELTPKGIELVEKINSGKCKDKLCWSWVMYCAGDGNTCQHLCGGIGKCNPECPNANMPNNLKNSNDRHRCRLRVVSESRLSWINTTYQLRIKIDGWHIPPNALVTHTPQVTRVNLTRSARDKIIISRRADRWTADDVKAKILVSKQGATEADLNQEIVKNRDICNAKQLKRLIVRDDRRVRDNAGPWTVLQHYIQDILKPRGHVLYYQNPDLSADENSPDRYYQLIVSDDLWLINGRDFGEHYFCIDGNNELNMDRATVLTIVVETPTGHPTPLANGDDKIPVKIAISTIKANIPCNRLGCTHPWRYEDLPNDKGFQKVRDCSSLNPWNPIAMVDQHIPIIQEVNNVVRGTVLSWTYIMLKLAEKLKLWDIPKSLRIEKPMMTNSLTEIIVRKIEDKLEGKMTPLAFLERLFGVKLHRDSLHADSSIDNNSFDQSLLEDFNTQSLLQQEQSEQSLPNDVLRRLNIGRFYFLSCPIEPAEKSHCYYVKNLVETSLTFTSSYDGKRIQLDNNSMNCLKPMINRYIERHGINIQDGVYLVNIKTGECFMCFDYIWNGNFRDVCKHVYAARIYAEGQKYGDFTPIIAETKQKLINYFRNKDDFSSSLPSLLSTQGNIKEIYSEIVRLYQINGDKMFDAFKQDDLCRDPFRNFKSRRRSSVKPGGPTRPYKRQKTNDTNKSTNFTIIENSQSSLQSLQINDMQNNERALISELGNSNDSITRVSSSHNTEISQITTFLESPVVSSVMSPAALEAITDLSVQSVERMIIEHDS